MVLSFFSIKVTAVYLGPAGIGTLGQLNYFMGLAQGAIIAGPQIGLVRRTAELGDDALQRARVVSTILRLALIIGPPVAVLIALNSDWLATHLLHDAQLRPALLVYAAVFVCGLAGAVIIGSALGAQDYRVNTTVNIGGGFITFLLVVTLCPTFGLIGALIAMAVLPAVTMVIAWLFARRSAWWPSRPLSHGFSAAESMSAVSYVPMAIINTVGMSVLQLAIRDNVAAHAGLASVGFLQGVMRLSDMYMGIAGNVFVMYFFPRFSELKLRQDLVRETVRGFVVILAAGSSVAFSLWAFRDLILHVVFTAEFTPMRDLFGWQMFGNTCNLLGQLFANLLLSKVRATAMSLLAVGNLVIWWLYSIYFVPLNGAVGATQAYAAMSATYMVVTMLGVVAVLGAMRRPDLAR
jgi:O-antigen/teichoic acid export membrane protein